MNTFTLQGAWRRDQGVILAAILICSALGWLYLLNASHSEASMPMHAGLFSIFWISTVMWSVMTVAMMLPTASPMILTFFRVQATRSGGASRVPVAFFVAGYLTVWVAFGLVAALLQTGAHSLGVLRMLMGSVDGKTAALLLILAGLFQWSALKEACLTKCRTPLNFLLAGWRPGRRGAWLMGLHHGALCLGCCWALMLLMFAGGVMNLAWMATLAVYMLVEKLVPRGWGFSRITGAGLIVAGGLMLGGLV